MQPMNSDTVFVDTTTEKFNLKIENAVKNIKEQLNLIACGVNLRGHCTWELASVGRVNEV